METLCAFGRGGTRGHLQLSTSERGKTNKIRNLISRAYIFWKVTCPVWSLSYRLSILSQWSHSYTIAFITIIVVDIVLWWSATPVGAQVRRKSVYDGILSIIVCLSSTCLKDSSYLYIFVHLSPDHIHQSKNSELCFQNHRIDVDTDYSVHSVH